MRKDKDVMSKLPKKLEVVKRHGFLLLLFVAAFLIYFFVLSHMDYELSEKSISKEDLLQKTAQDVIREIKDVNLYTVCADKTFIDGWPRKESIPYLLSVADSQEKIGIFFSCYQSIHPYKSETVSTVGAAALILLNAVKSGGFDMTALRKPDNPEALLAWARAEVEKMEGRD